MSEKYYVSSIGNDVFTQSYLKFGNGDKTLIILPGISLTSVISVPMALINRFKPLVNDYSIYVFDRLTPVKDDYTYFDFARLTIEAIKILDLKDLYLYGVSKGSALSLILAYSEPSLIKKMALASPLFKFSPEVVEILNDWSTYLEKKDYPGFFNRFFNDVFSKEYVDSNRSSIESYIRLSAKMVDDKEMIQQTREFLIQARTDYDFDISDKIKDINIKSIIFADKKDTVVPFKYSDELAEIINAEFVVFDKYSHAVFDEENSLPQRIYDYFERDD